MASRAVAAWLAASVLAASVLAAPLAGSAQPAIDLPALAAKQARRFPTPVRVGALLGQAVLRPVEAQPVLGRVAAVARRADGGLDVIVRYGGVLGLGARPIAVPVEAMALLGPQLAVLDFTPEQLDRFPSAPWPPAAPLGPDETIRVALTRPFH